MAPLSEAKVERMIASAIQKLATKLDQRQESTQASDPKKPAPSTEPKPGRQNVQCFFCKRQGHMKKDCMHFKRFLSQRGERAAKAEDDLNDKGLGGETTQ